MGVTGLWQIVQPCARPIKIETLNRKRLAVDASIWIYQFLKAVRDKEGNALRNSHVVGFFRRICKLLFFGIKPVFVFDGGAPALKRQTINARKSRREGRREDAVRTAGKLLAVQMQRRAEEEEARRKSDRDRRPEEEEAVPEDNLVYVDEIQMNQKERQQGRKFRKKDAYHLPDLDTSVSEMGGPNDPRIMSLEDLQEYARQFNSGEDINVYDFSKIDYDGPFFTSLPASDRYNILNAARLRSRLRMGHSKEQLDTMFPDRMAFSRFQIERVQERNELTQRLMHLNGAEDTTHGLGRIAGEKGREYVLIKNDGVEGGWALGVISDEGKEEKPIELDRSSPAIKQDSDDEWDDDDDFEDVPIEGLNRLPKLSAADRSMDQLMRQRRSLYKSRRSGARKNVRKSRPARAENSLFVQESEDEDVAEEEPNQNDAEEDLFGDEDGEDNADEELQKAIALSLQQDEDVPKTPSQHSEEDDDMLEVFQQQAAPEQMPLPTGSGRAIANIVNKRAFKAAPESREITSFGVPVPKPEDSDEDDTMDFRAALAESRRTKHKTSPLRHKISPSKPRKPVDNAKELARQAGFSGPLPFEKLDLGTSLLGKAKMKQREEETAGGFENPELNNKEQKKAGPLPPWFAGDIEKDLNAQKAIEREDREQARAFAKQFQFQNREGGTLQRAGTNEVIDLDEDDTDNASRPITVIDLDEDMLQIQSSKEQHGQTQVQPDKESRGSDHLKTTAQTSRINASKEADEEVPEVLHEERMEPALAAELQNGQAEEDKEDDGSIAWSESQPDEEQRAHNSSQIMSSPPLVPSIHRRMLNSGDVAQTHMNDNTGADTQLRSPSPAFEDVAIPEEIVHNDVEAPADFGAEKLVDAVPEGLFRDDDEFDDFSDPEEQEMLKALTQEAEEHARFASSLNNKPQAQNVREYEQELKQLRNQQKKDRRDADEVTHVMITECQQLLSLFGLPYVTAPMEAEAQCAELVRLGLVDGIVTDDSDCFLFGGTRIYKNMFNQAKFVECYLSSDLEKEFGFTRNKMISVAHLLGSDYTEGLTGVGPVTALEIISEFDTLDAFKDWYSAVQMNQIPKSEDASNPFRKKFRRNAQKLFLPTGFPDARVGLAYTEPEVDSDPEAFQWGVPDLDALRSFLMTTIGWSQERTDEILLPVIKDMNRRMDEGTQANITAFFDGSVGTGTVSNVRGEGFAPRKRAEGSKRMGNALKRMADNTKRRHDSVPEATVGDDAPNSAADDNVSTNTRKPRQKRVRITEQASDADPEEDVPPRKQAKSKRQFKTTS